MEVDVERKGVVVSLVPYGRKNARRQSERGMVRESIIHWRTATGPPCHTASDDLGG